MKTILLFGTFDGIHDGHRSCFSQARALADHLVVAVAPDAVVERLKGRPPKAGVESRARALKDEPSVDEVVVGDQELDSWNVLSMIHPDAVGIGYDQHELGEHLRAFARVRMPGLRIVRLEPFQPKTYKSSKL